MSSIKRKGVSDAVAIMLVIILALGLVVIIYNYILPITKKAAFSPNSNCAVSSLNSVIDLNGACFNNQTDDLEVNLSRKAYGNDVTSLYFVTVKGNNQVVWKCGNTCGGCYILNGGQAKTYYFKLTDKLDSVKVYSNNCLVVETKVNYC